MIDDEHYEAQRKTCRPGTISRASALLGGLTDDGNRNAGTDHANTVARVGTR